MTDALASDLPGEEADPRAVVLVIDDELEIRRFLRASLRANGYDVHEAVDGQEGIRLASTLRPDVIILDLGLPDMDGTLVLRRLREWSRVPVVALTARHGEGDKVAVLDSGADDYLTKPFSLAELLARLRVARRHSLPVAAASVFICRSLRIDYSTRLVTIGGTPVRLTKTEYALLKTLTQNAGRVLTHSQLLREVWGPEYASETHYLRVYVAQLRRKIETDPNHPTILLTDPGIGYRAAGG